MARPRNPETDEIIKLLGTKMTVRSVAAQLGLNEDKVQNTYYKHYDEILALQKAADRREKAEEIKARMHELKVAVEPEPAPVAVEPEAVPDLEVHDDPVYCVADFLAGNIHVRVMRKQWRNFGKYLRFRGVEMPAAYPFDLNSRCQEAVFRISKNPLRLYALWEGGINQEWLPVVPLETLIDYEYELEQALQVERKPDPAAVVEPEPAPIKYAEGLEMYPRVERAAEEKRSARLPKGPAASTANDDQVCGPLRVHGYIGECGRVYTLQGRTVEITGLAQRFTKEDLRALSNEILELARILDRREGASA